MLRLLYGDSLLWAAGRGSAYDIQCKTAVNETGEITFTLPPSSPLCGKLQRYQKHTEVVFERDGEELIRGRVVMDVPQLDGSVEYTVEGQRGYLNDSVLPVYSTDGSEGVTAPANPASLFDWYIAQHREQTGEAWEVGINEGDMLDANAHILRSSTQRPNTWEEVKSKLLEPLGGFTRARCVKGVRYIDWLAGHRGISTQTVEVGRNVVDAQLETDMRDYYTAFVPVGKDGLGIGSLPDGDLSDGLAKRGDMVYNVQTAAKHGIIQTPVKTDSETVQGCLDAAINAAKGMELPQAFEVTAVDLSRIDGELKPIREGEMVRCRFPHLGIDALYMCMERTVKVGEPDKYKLGGKGVAITDSAVWRPSAVDAEEALRAAQRAQESADSARVIAVAAQDSADSAQTAADAAQSAADGAQGTADSARSAAQTAQATASSAATAATQAQTTAQNAASAAATAQTTAAGAQTTAQAAQSAASSAQTAAEQAQSTASAASSAASSAQTAAAQAKTAADTAQSTADDAATAASTAQSTASAAQTTANQASTAASSAQTKANQAASAASSAQTTASAAQTAANQASSAASAAQTTATNAAAAASAAQSTADDAAAAAADAQDAADAADGKATTAAAAAATADGKAVSAQTAASGAQSTATSAASAAAAAQDAADDAASAAAAAQSAANAAQTKANTADTKATNAQTAATNAQSTANTANTKATNAATAAAAAQATADDAASAASDAQDAADAADTKATNAASAAAAAQTKANTADTKATNAATAAATADTKATNAQTTANTANTKATNAATAAATADSKAVAAQTTANAASSAASAAQTAANTAQAGVNKAIELISGTQTASTNAFTGTSSTLRAADIKDGLQIKYWLPFAGTSTAATLNLTLADGTTTGAKLCYYNGTTRLTTHCPVGSIINFTYRENVKIAGSSTTYTGWWCDANYNSDTQNRSLYSASTKIGTAAITRYSLTAADANGLYKNIRASVAFDVRLPIIYWSSATVAASSTVSSCGYTRYESININAYTQSISMTANKPLYLKGKLSGTTFTVASGTFLTQTQPTSADGYDYMVLGKAISATNIALSDVHDVFRYVGGAFKSIPQIAADALANAATADTKATNAATAAATADTKATNAASAASAAQSTANTANTKANQAATAAATADAKAVNAAKTATDFITDTGSAVVLTDKNESGFQLVLDYDSGAVLIKDTQGNTVASYSAEVVLGKTSGRHLIIDAETQRFMNGLTELLRICSGGSTTSHQAFVGSNTSQMFLYGGTSSAPSGVYLAAPPSVSSGGGIVASDQGIGLVFNDPAHPTWAHVYVSTADGFGNLADWVVERGEGDVGTYHWFWQKWANGKAECWGYSNSRQSVAVTSAWGSLYESSALNATFPSGLFIARPDFCEPSWEMYQYNVSSFEIGGNLSASRTQDVYLIRPTTATCQGWLRWHAIGRWK